MDVVLIGASGFVGSEISKELLSRGHTVTAIVRDGSKIPAQENLTVLEADVSDTDTLVEKLRGHDVVISAYNAGWTNPNYAHDFLQNSQSIQEATKRADIDRLIVIGGAGSLYNDGGKQLVDQPEFPAELKPAASAARDYFTLLSDETDLDWVFFSPAIEMNPANPGVKTGKYRLGLDNPVLNSEGRSILSVGDVAVVIVDELENPAHHRQRFTAAY